MVDLYDWIGEGKDQRERDLPTFKSMKEMLDYWDVTNYFGEYYGLPGKPEYSGDAFKEKKAQMEKERENEGKSNGKGNGKGKNGKSSIDVDPEDELKHGGRIKKKKRKKKGRPRGVGKALRGYGKAMKHGK